MSCYIIHGENTQASRQKLSEIKGSFDPALVSDVSSSGSLPLENQMFSQPKVVVLEFFGKDQLREFEAERFFSDLKVAGRDLTAVFWFGFELTASNKILSRCKAAGFQELKFSVSPLVFKLADSFFAPRGSKRSFYKNLSDFSDTKGDEVFLVQMLIRNTRLKLWASFKNSSYNNLSGFSKRQAQYGPHLNQKKLLSIFESLIFLERKVKSGPTDLVSNTLLLYESF